MEQILDFASQTPGDALADSGSLLRDILECGICNDIMLDPWTVSCGHTFCGPCLSHWFGMRQGRLSCPACRARITSRPAPAIALRQLANSIVVSFESAKSTKIERPNLNGTLFDHLSFGTAIWDEEESVYRCPQCSHEIAEGICSGCGREFPEADPDYSDEFEEGEGYTEGADLDEAPDSEDLAFIDDGSIDEGYDSEGNSGSSDEENETAHIQQQTARRRTHEVVDLTGDSDEESAGQLAQRRRIILDSDEDDDDL